MSSTEVQLKKRSPIVAAVLLAGLIAFRILLALMNAGQAEAMSSQYMADWSKMPDAQMISDMDQRINAINPRPLGFSSDGLFNEPFDDSFGVDDKGQPTTVDAHDAIEVFTQQFMTTRVILTQQLAPARDNEARSSLLNLASALVSLRFKASVAQWLGFIDILIGLNVVYLLFIVVSRLEQRRRPKLSRQSVDIMPGIPEEVAADLGRAESRGSQPEPTVTTTIQKEQLKIEQEVQRPLPQDKHVKIPISAEVPPSEKVESWSATAGADEKTHWLDRPLAAIWKPDVEQIIYLIFILAAIFTRFWMLGDRVMSHDESLHVYFSWNLFQGLGFSHTPLMHGPLKFELTAFVYSLFGASDFTARISVAAFGVVLVALPYFMRRWLGRVGALATSFMLLISPSIWYHARYIRDEAYMLVWSMLVVIAIFSYLRTRSNRWLYFLAIIVALMYTTMEAAFIFSAVFGLFLVVMVLIDLSHREGFWSNTVVKTVGALLAAVIVLGALVVLQSLILGAIGLGPGDPSPFPVPPAPLQPGVPIEFSAQLQFILQMIGGLLKVLLSLLIPIGLFGLAAYKWFKFMLPDQLRESAAFDLALIILTLSLFMLSAGALPILNSLWLNIFHTSFVDVSFFADGNFPTNDVGLVLRLALVFSACAALAVALGLWWDRRRWLISAGIFIGIGVTLFTTIFTNGVGLGTGFVGSLGYWLEQQGVARGSQPVYYYFIVTPIYEYLPILLSITGTLFYFVRWLIQRRSASSANSTDRDQRLFKFFAWWWLIASWVAYSVAGEKMPWLMVYLALPMIVFSGRFLGKRLERIDWPEFIRRRVGLIGLLIAAAVVAGSWTIGSLRQAFSGLQSDSLIAFSNWLSAIIVLAIALFALWRFKPRPNARSIFQSVGLLGFVVLAGLTFRTGWMWNFINYDSALEYGVYAHGGPGVKIAMQQIEELSLRTLGDHSIHVTYDADASWPFYWYLRDYPNKTQMSDSPSRADLDSPIIIASSKNWTTLDGVLRTTYTHAQFHRIWWPMEDYKVFANCPSDEVNAAGELVKVAAYDENGDGTLDDAEKARGEARCNSYSLRHLPEYLATVWNWLIGDPQKRAAMESIFLNRDYTLYDQIKGEQHTPDQWPLVDDFRLYVRNDLAAQIWTQAAGVNGVITTTAQTDPYASGMQNVAAALVFGSTGLAPGQFGLAHGLSIGPDGSIYVADGTSEVIEKFDQTGKFVAAIGGSSGDNTANPPIGLFKEPWDVAAAPDGSIYVADTWNHRIQHMTADGTFINAWGTYSNTNGQAAGEEGGFFGPRGIAVDTTGNVYVADTGNKRIQIFDATGKFVTQFGGVGLLPGYLDEPVGIAVDVKGNIVVADTWNARIQVFGSSGVPIANWEIDGWLDKDLVGKPYVAVDQQQRVYVADEVGRRVLVFDETGKYLGGFGGFGSDNTSFNLPGGIAVDKEGYIYVVDTGSGRVLKFPPFQAAP